MDLEQQDELCLGAGLELSETGAEGNDTEEHWRRLFPTIRDCTVVIVRLPPEQLKLWGAEQPWRDKRKRTPNLRSGWDRMWKLQPRDRGGRFESFVKKVRVQANVSLEDEAGRPHSRLRLTHCTDSTHLQNNDLLHQSEVEHSYCLIREGQDILDGGGQQQESRLAFTCDHRGHCSCPTGNSHLPRPREDASSFFPGDRLGSPPEKKSIPTVVEEAPWLLRRSQLKKGSEEEEEIKKRRRRRQACGLCIACIRKDCGECIYCLDKRKFGGPSTKRQKCVHRRCLVVLPRKDLKTEVADGPESREEMVTPVRIHLSRQRREDVERQEFCSSVKQSEKWERMLGSRRMERKHLMVGNEAKKEEEEREEETAKAQQVIKTTMDQKELSGDQSEAGMDEEETMEDKKTSPPEELLKAKVLQLNLTLNGGHLSSDPVSDSALGSLSGLLHQGGEFLHVSTGLTLIPAVTVEPKEEEEPVEVELYGRSSAAEGLMGGRAAPWEEVLFREGVSEKGKYLDMEVQLIDPNQEPPILPPPTPSDITTPKAADDVMGWDCDVTTDTVSSDRPEFLPVSWGAYDLHGGGVGPDDLGGCGLKQLLELLRRIVLPAHWVGVLADGPEVQLLQCSRLSAMTDTIVHIQPDLCFYITVQNRLLPGSHRVHRDHTHTVSHLSQLVSLLLDLESLTLCRSLKRQLPSSLQHVRSFDCHLLVAPSCITCLPCLLEEDEEEEEEEEEEED